MLSGLSKAIDLQLQEVQRKNQMLTLFKAELDTIHNADQEQRGTLEAEKVKLEEDQQNYEEQLRRVRERLHHVEVALRHAEEEKNQKIQDLYKNYRSHGLLTAS